jgi:predicted metal-dependent hydrolase
MSNRVCEPLKQSKRDFVTYGGEKIYYQRLARSEAIGRLKVKVYPDCRVEVVAPPSATELEVKKGVELKARWIINKLRLFKEQLEGITPRKYVSGESHYYLGKQYMLKVEVSISEPCGVKLLRGVLRVTVREQRPDLVRKQLVSWYRIRAREIFSKRMDSLLEQTLWVSEKPSMRILAMKSQWGSCSPKGLITLNPMLVKASRDCIDYVILHEFCHLAEHNHGKKFYRLMGQVMPNWETVKNRLDGMAVVFLNL